MSESDLLALMQQKSVASWRMQLARWIESTFLQRFIIAVILLNSAVLGLETFPGIMAEHGATLKWIDRTCLAIFVLELGIKMAAYRQLFWRNGWNWFDFLVVAVALVPGSGPLAILRTFRVFRVLRLLTALPALRRVVAAFLHSIPGLTGVIMIMAIFFFTAGVLATHLFGSAFPHWFGNLGESLYSLFQIMTLESWSMGIARPVMDVYPWAWAFFIPFIVIATFTILNLFIGIIVSTMQELSELPDPDLTSKDVEHILERMENDMASLRKMVKRSK
ncbi:ion transporter [Sulfuriroseicoccus oceanibius]|uniref:Ion transporter n=1 Tax=Sulfuriroseicoccus oceanibius TaxID=2707525 RepID=A0A7T7JCD1_9BACT|nr:ion transporter [Sulfuriroseicoccus oceanibius]QQL45188.1 ion transporter [Sulfuriroseicoccus oceanibius]